MSRIDKIEKNFVPQDHEQEIYQTWQDSGCFKANNHSEKKPFTIVMPPPNITGVLHMGHALDVTLQDILIRLKRMQNYEVLWLPGTDHAAIATEAKIVASMREEGLSKDDIGREKFLERAWQWKKTYGDRIIDQIKHMGSSCDWSRLRFTMDEGLSKAVEKVFIDLYKEKLIYRGERIINWCPSCMTSISDAEVEYEEKSGHFWHIRYPFVDGDGYLEIATTRPETLLGDTAVAVHPDDERYQQYIGRTLISPLVNREIPVVADRYVDPEFGSGVVKITPAHDPNDFEVGERHNLERINVFNEDASINENGGKYEGLSNKEARKQIVKDLEEQGYLIRIEDIVHSVSTCYRCHSEIEPRLSKQWFVAMRKLAEPAIKAVQNQDIRFVPDRFSKNYFHWMENIRDWNISRQLWWGHRIPAWFCDDCGQFTVAKEVGEIPQKCEHCGSLNLRQEEDTLDTWFSSALWPFSTLGWPEKTEDYEAFYPTDVLVTGYDIITFWVSRMIFSGLHYTGQEPFKDVLIHGIVRDEQGRKMSKSLGNGIDPLEVIDKYGADALRYALVAGVSAGNDLRYKEDRVENGRNFINKVWNAFRFTMMNIEDELTYEDLNINFAEANLANEDKWILNNLQILIEEVTYNMEQYDFGIALTKIYNFLWENFCDWYIEMIKPRLNGTDQESRLIAQAVLNEVLNKCMILLHPFMPFFTEEIYKSLKHNDGMLIKTNWPQKDENLIFEKEAMKMNLLIEMIHSIRNIRSQMKVPNKKKSRLIIVVDTEEIGQIFMESEAGLANLAMISHLEIKNENKDIPETAIAIPFSSGTAYLPSEDLIDLEAEKERLAKEIANYDNEILRAEKKLTNENFVKKAPSEVVEKEKEKLAEYQKTREQAQLRLQELS